MNVYLDLLNAHVLVTPALIHTDPKFNVVGCGLGKIPAEPVGPLAALLGASQTVFPVPQTIFQEIRISECVIAVIVFPHKRRDIGTRRVDITGAPRPRSQSPDVLSGTPIGDAHTIHVRSFNGAVHPADTSILNLTNESTVLLP